MMTFNPIESIEPLSIEETARVDELVRELFTPDGGGTERPIFRQARAISTAAYSLIAHGEVADAIDIAVGVSTFRQANGHDVAISAEQANALGLFERAGREYAAGRNATRE